MFHLIYELDFMNLENNNFSSINTIFEAGDSKRVDPTYIAEMPSIVFQQMFQLKFFALQESKKKTLEILSTD